MLFRSKTLIHPKQLAAANASFAPAPQAIVRARKIIDAWQQASAEGKAVVVVDGRLVENLHVQEAERDLELAERIARVGW